MITYKHECFTNSDLIFLLFFQLLSDLCLWNILELVIWPEQDNCETDRIEFCPGRSPDRENFVVNYLNCLNTLTMHFKQKMHHFLIKKY